MMKLLNLKQLETWGKLFFSVGFFNCSAAFLLLTCAFAFVWMEFSFSYWSCSVPRPFLSIEDVFPHRMNGQNLRVIFAFWLVLSLFESAVAWLWLRLSLLRLAQSLGQIFFKNTVALLVLMGFLAQPNYRGIYFLLAFFLGIHHCDQYQKTAKQRQLQNA